MVKNLYIFLIKNYYLKLKSTSLSLYHVLFYRYSFFFFFPEQFKCQLALETNKSVKTVHVLVKYGLSLKILLTQKRKGFII